MAPTAFFERLRHGNYEDWSPMMEALLIDKDVWEVVVGDGEDGAVEAPLGGPASKAVKAFRRKQQVAKATIILNVDKTQLPHCRFDTPDLVWKELERVHRSRGFGSLLALRRAFFNMKKKPDQAIQSWAADVRHAAYLLEKADFDVSDIDKILALTQGLPDSFSPLIIALDTGSVDQLTFESVIDRLLNEESRQSFGHLVDEPIEAMAVSGGNRHSSGGKKTGLKGVRCHRCRGYGHMRNACPSNEEDVVAAAVAESDDEDIGCAALAAIGIDSDCDF